jgi:hypothetical protein
LAPCTRSSSLSALNTHAAAMAHYLIPRQLPEADSADIDYSSNAPKILAITGTLTGLSCLLVVLRCYVRIFVLRRFYIEDYIMVFCGVSALAIDEFAIVHPHAHILVD